MDWIVSSLALFFAWKEKIYQQHNLNYYYPSSSSSLSSYGSNGDDDDNDNYSPTGIVEQCHKILHLDNHLQQVSNQFQAFHIHHWNNYVKSLLPVPIICSSLGILAVFTLQFFLILRMYNKKYRFLPKITMTGRKSLTLVKYAIDPRFFLLFKVFIILVIIFVDEILLFGSYYLQQGVNSAKDNISTLKGNITSLIDQGDNLYAYGNFLSNDLNTVTSFQSSCNSSVLTSLNEGISTSYDVYVNDYLSYLTPLPGKCDDSDDNLDRWGIRYKNDSVWTIYSLFISLVVIYAISLRWKNKIISRIAVGFGECVTLVLFVLIAVEMVIVVRAFFHLLPYPLYLLLLLDGIK